MSSTNFGQAAEAILAHLRHAPELARLGRLLPEADLGEAGLREIVGAAAALAEGVLVPFNRQADAEGCSLVNGRVRLARGHAAAWQAFVDGGWTTVDAPEAHGGAGLPLAVHAACEELFNRASPAFGMLPTPMRCAARVIAEHADAAIQAEWLPRLIDGTWGATICLSEADAGSDVPRLRTLATPGPDGIWSVTGEKMWISFGDHDLTARIGHMVLARTPDAPPGSAGLSLFLVPSTWEGQPNGITVRRVEEKLGLHGSPTCALGFEGARGRLIGSVNRGLSQLFTMIIGMRLSVGSQGAGIAGAAAALAWRYAAERRQGGPATAPPVTIDRHGDVQRLLLDIAARAEMARGLVLVASLISDLRQHETDPAAQEDAAGLLEWLLPITKNFCAETAFTCASEAVQILGGAGYTREWPAEQYLRDARVLSIYEGTSGMQALDLTLRRVLGDGGRALSIFLEHARQEMALATDRVAAGQMADLLSLLVGAREGLVKATAPIVAYPFLQLASSVTTGWIALRLARQGGTPVTDHLAALGRHWLRTVVPRAHHDAALVALGPDLAAEFPAINPDILG